MSPPPLCPRTTGLDGLGQRGDREHHGLVDEDLHRHVPIDAEVRPASSDLLFAREHFLVEHRPAHPDVAGAGLDVLHEKDEFLGTTHDWQDRGRAHDVGGQNHEPLGRGTGDDLRDLGRTRVTLDQGFLATTTFRVQADETPAGAAVVDQVSEGSHVLGRRLGFRQPQRFSLGLVLGRVDLEAPPAGGEQDGQQVEVHHVSGHVAELVRRPPREEAVQQRGPHQGISARGVILDHEDVAALRGEVQGHLHVLHAEELAFGADELLAEEVEEGGAGGDGLGHAAVHVAVHDCAVGAESREEQVPCTLAAGLAFVHPCTKVRQLRHEVAADRFEVVHSGFSLR